MIQTDRDTRVLTVPLYVLATYAVGVMITEAAPIFLWVATSFFIFVLLDRPARYLIARGWPPALGAALLTIVAMVVIGGALYLFGNLMAATAGEFDRSRSIFVGLVNRLNEQWTFLNDKIAAWQAIAPANDVAKVQVVEPAPLGGAVGGTILHGFRSAVSVLTFALLVPILTFFLLAERAVLGRILRRGFRDGACAERAWDKIVSASTAFFAGNLVLGAVTFPLFLILLLAFGTPSYVSLAGVAAILNLVPFAGAILAGFFPAVMLYTATQSWLGPLALYGSCFVVHLVAADVVIPKVLGARVNINATTSTVAMVVWGEIWGGLGLILAIPLVSIIKILFEHSSFPTLHWLAGLMSSEVDEALS